MFHEVVQPRHVRVDVVSALTVFGQVCGAAKAGQVGADDADVRDELQQIVRDDFQAVVVAAEAVHEQHGVGAFGEGSVVHAFAVLPVAGNDCLRAVTNEGVVAGTGNERAGHTLKNRGVGGVRGNGGGHGYLSRVGYWDGKVPFLILGEKP